MPRWPSQKTYVRPSTWPQESVRGAAEVLRKEGEAMIKSGVVDWTMLARIALQAGDDERRRIKGPDIEQHMEA